jgi:hypothetical protein
MRQYKIEISDGTTMSFFIHEDDKIDNLQVSGLSSMPYMQSMLNIIGGVISLLRTYNVRKIEITKQ